MASSFSSGSSYIYLSNARAATLIEHALRVGRDLAKTDSEKRSAEKLERWWREESFPGIPIELDKLFTTEEEFKLWAQSFESLAWMVFRREFGNHNEGTWQVGFISSCHVISRMLTELVWKTDRTWYPESGDTVGIRPDPMKIQL